MPTPSDSSNARRSWQAKPGPARSIFGTAPESPKAKPKREAAVGESGPHAAGRGLGQEGRSTHPEAAAPRAFIYRFLAKAYEDPSVETWKWLCASQTLSILKQAVEALAPNKNQEANTSVRLLALSLRSDQFEAFQNTYVAVFGHAARGRCPLNEIEYGGVKADALFQPHQLADLAAFYRAFGLELAEGASERQDHICLELEFMCVLAAKETYAVVNRIAGDALAVCKDAERTFLREHLARWTPAFTRRLENAAGETTLAWLARFTRDFISAECRLFGLAAGNEGLMLRPADERADGLCGGCGAAQLPPGAARPGL